MTKTTDINKNKQRFCFAQASLPLEKVSLKLKKKKFSTVNNRQTIVLLMQICNTKSLVKLRAFQRLVRSYIILLINFEF